MHWYPALVDHLEVGSKIVGLSWQVRDVSDSEQTLLIADEPCIFEGGIDDPRLIIALPLSPTKTFLAIRQPATAAFLANASSDEIARRVNRASFLQARTRIYGHDDQAADFIRECLVTLGEERQRVLSTPHAQNLETEFRRREPR